VGELSESLATKDCSSRISDTGQRRPLFDQDKSDLEIDAVLRNFSILHDDLLFLDPRAFHILEGLGRAINAFLDGIFEALIGTGYNFRKSGYRHAELERDGIVYSRQGLGTFGAEAGAEETKRMKREAARAALRQAVAAGREAVSPTRNCSIGSKVNCRLL
jgi:hypothetical protein